MTVGTETAYPYISGDVAPTAAWAQSLIRALEERDLINAETRLTWNSIILPTSQIAFVTPDADAPNTGAENHAEFPAGADRSMLVPFQTPSTWKPGTNRVVSVRWSKATSASGDVDWQIRHRYRSVGAVVSSWSSWAAGSIRQSDDNTAGVEAETFWEIAADAMPFLSTFEVQFKRFGSTDSYAGTGALWSVAVYLQCGYVGGHNPWETRLSVGSS